MVIVCLFRWQQQIVQSTACDHHRHHYHSFSPIQSIRMINSLYSMLHVVTGGVPTKNIAEAIHSNVITFILLIK